MESTRTPPGTGPRRTPECPARAPAGAASPAAAIIAALSVQRSKGGTTTRRPLNRALTASRSARLAATPPTTATVPAPVRSTAAAQAVDQLIDGGHLEARGQVGDHPRVAGGARRRECARTEVADHVAHRGLEAAERERSARAGCGAAGIAPGSPDARSAAWPDRPGTPRPSRRATLSKASPAASSPGGREALGDAVLAKQDALGVSAADQQGQVGRLEIVVGEPGAVHVPGEVRDADDRQPPGHRCALSHTWCRRSGSRPARDLGSRPRHRWRPNHPGPARARRPRPWPKPLQVGASRQLGNDPAVDRVQSDLRRHHRGADLAVVGEHRRRGLVTGGLDGEEIQADGYSIEGPPPTPATSRPLRIAVKRRLNSGAWMLSLHMITASSPLSV